MLVKPLHGCVSDMQCQTGFNVSGLRHHGAQTHVILCQHVSPLAGILTDAVMLCLAGTG